MEIGKADLSGESTQVRWQLATLAAVVWCASMLEAQNNSAEVQAHMARARQALAQHDLQRASQEYAEILKLDPRNAEIYTAQGTTLYALGRPAEAVKALESALQLDSTQTTAETFLGLSKSDLGRCREAEPLLRKHFNERTEPKLRRMVGLTLLNCYAGTSELDQALDLARALDKSYPGDADVLYNLAEVYSQLLNAAVAELLKQHPDSYRIHQLAGETLEAQGENARALTEYRKALGINPKVSRIHYRIGRLLASGDAGPEARREAMAHFQQELAVNPADAASEYQIAEILRKDRQLDEARKHFLRALELSPNFAEARVGLANIYVAENHFDLALKELYEAVREQPENSSAHYTRMVVYRDLGRAEDAQRELAIFKDLEARKEKDFRSQLRSLLTGKTADADKPR